MGALQFRGGPRAVGGEAAMRIWDVPPHVLCRQHLLAEHRELHGIWNIITKRKQGYARHPETRRWKGRLGALYARHEALVVEMARRGYNHQSPLDAGLAAGPPQDRFVDSIERQWQLLRDKPCPCPLEA